MYAELAERDREHLAPGLARESVALMAWVNDEADLGGAMLGADERKDEVAHQLAGVLAGDGERQDVASTSIDVLAIFLRSAARTSASVCGPSRGTGRRPRETGKRTARRSPPR